MPEKLKKLGESPAEERIKPEIPEQRMKRELAKIPDEDQKYYEWTLERMGLLKQRGAYQPNPRDILSLNKLHKFAEELQLMFYVPESMLQKLGPNGVIKNSEDLEKFVDSLEKKVFKPCKESHRNRDSISTALDGIFLSALPEISPKTIKSPQRAVDYVVELYELAEPLARTGLKVDSLLRCTVPALDRAGVMSNPEEIIVFREELSGLVKRAGDNYSGLFEKNFPEIVKRVVRKAEDVATVADGLSTPRIIECADSLHPKDFAQLDGFKLDTHESFGEKIVEIYLKTKYKYHYDTRGKKIRSLLSDNKLSELHVREMMRYIALLEGSRVLGIANLEINSDNLLAMHKIHALYDEKDPFSQFRDFKSFMIEGLAQTQEEMKLLADIAERYPPRQAKRLYNDLNTLKHGGVMETTDDLRSGLDLLIKLGKLFSKMEVDPEMASTYIARLVLLDKKVGSLKELQRRVDNVATFSELGIGKDRDVYPLLEVIPLLEDAGLLKPPGNSALIFKDLASNPHVIGCMPHISADELSQLKPQSFSAQVIELGVKEIARIVDFPIEKMASEQRKQLSKILNGLEFISENEEIQTLIKHGLENTYRQHYDSLEENKNALKQMQELGINTDVYLHHKEIEKMAFRIESGKVLRMETGEEHVRSTLHSVVNQLFNNQAGEVFKNPAKVFAEIAQDPEFPRKYKSREERVEAAIEMINSNDKEWLKGAMSILERHLKTAGTKASSIVDSDEMQGQSRIALVHIQRAKALFGMEVRPLKGETGGIIISLKMCDKNPLTTITLGNDAGCCMGLSEQNKWAWPLYLKDMSIQIGEIFIKKEGKESRVGPVWLFAGKINGESALVIDSIDMTSAYREMDEVYRVVIDYMKDFAEKVGFKRVVMGTYFNDANPYAEKNFTKEKVEIEKIYAFSGRFYLDVLHNNKPKETVEVFVIK